MVKEVRSYCAKSPRMKEKENKRKQNKWGFKLNKHHYFI